MHIDLSFEPLVAASDARNTDATSEPAVSPSDSARRDGTTRKRRHSDLPEAGARGSEG